MPINAYILHLFLCTARLAAENVLFSPALGYKAFGCHGDYVAETPRYMTLDAGGGHAGGDVMCRVIAPRTVSVDVDSYDVTVQLFHQQGEGRQDAGSPGIAFNVVDENNFDFVLFRWVMTYLCVKDIINSVNCGCSIHNNDLMTI